MNDAETIFERLEAHGRTWKVYVAEPMPLSFAGIIHYPRLKDRLATHFVPFAEFEKDAAAGTLPDFSLIEPNMASGHGDYHPALGRSLIAGGVDLGLDPPSSILGGEAFLERIFNIYRSCTSESGTNVWNTALLIGWDEPGGTYDHVPPGPAVPPDPAAPAGEFGFTFDRSGYRVPAIIGLAVGRVRLGLQRGVPPHLADRHPAKAVGSRPGVQPARRSARTFDDIFTRETPRNPDTWVAVEAAPVPDWSLDYEVLGKALSHLGNAAGPALIEKARALGATLPPELDDPSTELTPQLIVEVLREVSWHFFPRLAPVTSDVH